MIRKLFSIGFILAVLANGWGSVLAAELCKHLNCEPLAAAQAQHASHHGISAAGEHASDQVEPSEHHSHHGVAGWESEPPAGKAFRPVGQHERFCGHCIGAPQSPVRSASKGTPPSVRRDSGGGTSSQPVRVFVLPGVAAFPAISPSQQAPPVPAQRRHLLINIFLI